MSTLSELSDVIYDEVFDLNAISIKPKKVYQVPNKRHRSPKGTRKIKLPKSNEKQKREEYINKLTSREALVYTYGLIPRIVKGDIRRQYATMFINAQNSYNENMIVKFLEVYNRHDVMFLYRKNGVYAANEAVHCELKGAVKLAKIWSGSLGYSPDMIYHINDTAFTLRADNTSMITTRFSIFGTKLVDRLKLPKLSLIAIESEKLKENLYSQLDSHHTNNTPNNTTNNTVIDTADQTNNTENNTPNNTDINSPRKETTTPITFSQQNLINQQYTQDIHPKDKYTKDIYTKVYDMFETTKAYNPNIQSQICQLLQEGRILINSNMPFKYYKKKSMNNIEPELYDPIGLPFFALGTVKIHIDEDSKIFLIEYSIDTSAQRIS